MTISERRFCLKFARDSPRYLPDPLSGIVWFALEALSWTVTAEGDCGPFEAGTNSTVSLHVFCGNNCCRQFAAPARNPNTCGLVVGTENATGLAKLIGGPLWAELVSVNVIDLSCPTVTSPKLPDDGLIFKSSGTGVGLAVGVAVRFGLGVRVAVAVAVAVRVAVGVAVGVPPVSVAVAVGVDVAVGVGVASGASFPIPLSATCCGAFEALSEIVRISGCGPLASGLNTTPILHLLPTRTLEPQVLLPATTANSEVPKLILLITISPLFDFGFDNSSVFGLLLVPNF